MDKHYQIFVSSTLLDLRKERRAIMQAIQKFGQVPIGMELFPSDSAEAWKVIERMIEQSDYYVLVVAGRYGSQTKEGISFTEKEYDYASKLNIPVIPYIHSDPGRIPQANCETEAQSIKKLDNFKSRLKLNHTPQGWKTTGRLVNGVITSLANAMNIYPRSGWVRGDAVQNAAQLSEKLNQLYERCESLEAENAILKSSVAFDALQQRLAGDSDQVNLVFECVLETAIQDSVLGLYRPIEKIERTSTWREVFQAIAPGLYAAEVRGLLIDRLPAYFKVSHPDSKDIKLTADTGNRIRNQLIARRLISMRKDDYPGTGHEKWLLSSDGLDYFAQFTAAFKPETPEFL